MPRWILGYRRQSSARYRGGGTTHDQKGLKTAGQIGQFFDCFNRRMTGFWSKLYNRLWSTFWRNNLRRSPQNYSSLVHCFYSTTVFIKKYILLYFMHYKVHLKTNPDHFINGRFLVGFSHVGVIWRGLSKSQSIFIISSKQGWVLLETR